MAIEKRRYGPGELNAFVSGGPPASDDELSITTDGFRLDSAEAVIAFVAELNGEDFVEDFVREGTVANPEFPALLEDARRRRREHRSGADPGVDGTAPGRVQDAGEM